MSAEAYLVVQTLGFATGVGLFALLGLLFLQARRARLEPGPRALYLAGAATALLCLAWDACQLGAALATAAEREELARLFAVKGPVSYTHLTLPTIYSV